MKERVFATAVVLILSASVVQAQSLRGLSSSAQTGVGAIATNGPSGDPGQPSNTSVLSLFDRDMVKEFNQAWQRAANGTALVEAVVLIVRTAEGSYKAILPNPTREYRQFTFRWQPGTIAVLHTHPNRSDPRPQPTDIEIAERFQVPMFTLTIHGMFLYDPRTKAISKVQNGVDWLEYSKWRRDAPVMAVPLAARQ